eukprot:366275-Chlamydomonas_euryale.AAC.9
MRGSPFECTHLPWWLAAACCASMCTSAVHTNVEPINKRSDIRGDQEAQSHGPHRAARHTAGPEPRAPHLVPHTWTQADWTRTCATSACATSSRGTRPGMQSAAWRAASPRMTSGGVGDGVASATLVALRRTAFLCREGVEGGEGVNGVYLCSLHTCVRPTKRSHFAAPCNLAPGKPGYVMGINFPPDMVVLQLGPSLPPFSPPHSSTHNFSLCHTRRPPAWQAPLRDGHRLPPRHCRVLRTRR